jgi:urease accessory protein
MNVEHRFSHQRAQGEIVLGVARRGLTRLREAGAAKVRFPEGGGEAILINTGGGLAGGDRFSSAISVGAGAALTVTTQAAERTYRSLGPAADVETRLEADAGACLMWLPQEMILFEGAALQRRLEAEIAASARFLAVESLVFGRKAMGEAARQVNLNDRWRIRRQGKLIFAEDLRIAGLRPATLATLQGSDAMATVVLVAADAERHLDAVRAFIGEAGGASAWDGKLVARLLAKDGFELRKRLIPLLSALAGGSGLPKVWSM